MQSKSIHFLLVVLLITSSFLPTTASSQSSQNNSSRQLDDSDWKLVWSDEFDGNELDLSKWSYDTGNGFVQPDGNYVPGWGNQELQYYSEDNVKVQGGKLVIEGKKETVSDDRGTYDYTSGKITTRGLYSKTYGKFEARIKLPAGQGYWPAFWMMPENDVYGGWAASGEIDIMEAAGARVDRVGGAIHYGGQWPNNSHTAADYHFPNGEDITDFHVYSVEWEPGEIRYYVDGNLYQTLNNWSSTSNGNPAKFAYPAPFDQDFYLILNLAIGGWYGGNPDDTTNFPGVMEVDYVKVYELEGKEYLEPVEPSFDKEALPSGAKTAIDGSYVYDHEYNEGFTIVKTGNDQLDETYWNFVHLDMFGGNGTVSVDTIDNKKFAKVQISEQGNQTYSLQLIQNVTLGKGRYYKLSFDAKSEVARNMNVKLNGGESRGWKTYSSNYEVPLTEEVNSYEYVFQMQDESDILARLEFNLGLNSNTVWIGNVRLEEVEAIDPYKEMEDKEPLEDGNHVYNGTFDLGRMDRMTYWDFTSQKNTATASVNADARELAVSISDGGSEESIKLVQSGMNLQPNDEYQIQFDARAAGERDIKVALVSRDGNVQYTELQSVSLTTAMEEKILTVVMPDTLDTGGQLVFLLGGSNHDVFLDNVKMVRLTNSNVSLTLEEIFPLRNGDFSKELEYWNKHVQGNYDGPSSASFAVEKEMAKVSIGHEGINPWDVIFMQEGLSLKAGNQYVVSFDAKSTVERQFELVVDNASYHRYLSETLDLTTDFKHFAFEFDMTQDDTVGLKYLLGKISGGSEIGAAHDVYFDNVRLEVKGEREKAFPLTNGSFSNGDANWVQHIQGVYDGSSKASMSFEDEAKITIEHTGVNPWDVLLAQEGLSLNANKQYVLHFDAKSTTDRKLEVIIDNGAPSYHRYFANILELTGESQTFSFEFEMPNDDVIGVKFLLGSVENAVIDTLHDVVIDNVRLEVKGARELLESEPTEQEVDKDWKEDNEEELPNTSTPFFNWLLLGLTLAITGLIFFILQRRKLS